MRNVRIPAHVTSQEVDGDEIVLDLTTGKQFSLNEAGRAIWTALRDGLGEEAIVEVILRGWRTTPEAAREDVNRLVGVLVEHGLLEVIPPAEP